MNNLRIERKMPEIKAYNNLFINVYDSGRDEEIIKEAFKNTLEFICVYDGEELVGFSRLIGDKTIFLYFQDVMVKKEYQGRGIGKKIIEYALDIVREYKKINSEIRVYVCAAKDRESFYEKYGFLRRPNEFVGAGMILKPDFE